MIIASKRIAHGEQITVNYLCNWSIRQPGPARRKTLMKSHSFKCECAVCEPATEKLKTPKLSWSDWNRKRLRAILHKWHMKGLDQSICPGAKQTTLAEADEALELSTTEGLVAELTGIWIQKFYVHAAYDEFREAKRCARNSLEALARIRGRNVAKQNWMAEYADDPKRWDSYGICAVQSN